MSAIDSFISFLATNKVELAEQTGEHLWLTLISLILSSILGLCLGILISKKEKWSTSVLGLVNIFQTIPSVALLGFLLPFFGIGVVPAIIALFLYGLLPIVRNTYTGLTGVDPIVVEAAKGMGLSKLQLLTKVEIPLALPVIFAGIRTAFVINVGVATLCALIAAGGLGEFIFRGLSTNNTNMILAGAIPAALLAILFDFIIGVIQKHINRLLKPLLIVLALTFSFLIVYQFASDTSKKLRAGFPSEFIGRSDGYIGLKEKYALDLDVNEMEIGLMYQAVRDDYVDVISGFSTDGRIEAFDLKLLEDDKNYFPPYHAAPIVRGEIIRKYPKIKEALELVSGRISNSEMSAMNYLVDEKHADIRKVAADFLLEKGFKTSIVRSGEADIVVGSKNFTESYILAEVFKILIENYTPLTVELKLGFGGTKLNFDALQTGGIDIYPEYTGTGLLVILQPEEAIMKTIKYDQGEIFSYVSNEFKQKFDLEWLNPLGFNNTHALMMRKEKADEMGINKISDLAE